MQMRPSNWTRAVIAEGHARTVDPRQLEKSGVLAYTLILSGIEGFQFHYDFQTKNWRLVPEAPR